MKTLSEYAKFWNRKESETAKILGLAVFKGVMVCEIAKNANGSPITYFRPGRKKKSSK